MSISSTCFGELPVISRTRLMLGTVISISAYHGDIPAAEAAIEAAFVEIARLREIFDRHQAGTPVDVLNRQGSLSDAPEELLLVMERALETAHLTGNAFDMTVQPVVDFLREHKNPQSDICFDPRAFAEVRKLVRPDGVQLGGRTGARSGRIRLAADGMGITLDAIAKGYIADKASECMTALGIGAHLINAGGDIRAQGSKGAAPWIAGIENPMQRGSVLTVLPLRDRALATSGGYEIFYDQRRKHHHLINPATGQSPTVQSVSVLAPSTMEADALATALSILPADDALRLVAALPGRECLLVTADNTIKTSEGWG